MSDGIDHTILLTDMLFHNVSCIDWVRYRHHGHKKLTHTLAVAGNQTCGFPVKGQSL